MFHIDKAHYIVDEMVANGCIVENNKANILKPLALMDKAASADESIFSRRWKKFWKGSVEILFFVLKYIYLIKTNRKVERKKCDWDFNVLI